jgi:hypothetical protein
MIVYQHLAKRLTGTVLRKCQSLVVIRIGLFIISLSNKKIDAACGSPTRNFFG